MNKTPKYYFYKNKFKFEKLFDFNELVKVIDLVEQSSEFSMSRKVNANYVFDSTFVMRGISNTSAFFKDLNTMLDKEFNKNKILYVKKEPHSFNYEALYLFSVRYPLVFSSTERKLRQLFQHQPRKLLSKQIRLCKLLKCLIHQHLRLYFLLQVVYQ